uniref:Uncharacterized protein n=1 Tax=Timema poppense TaxID=170557 RepID=A0A7R9D380_TIMPO|nr:unnamed protein product [Timema poppensis]
MASIEPRTSVQSSTDFVQNVDNSDVKNPHWLFSTAFSPVEKWRFEEEVKYITTPYRPSQNLANALTDKFKTRLPVQIKVKTSNLAVTPHSWLHISKQTPNQISKFNDLASHLSLVTCSAQFCAIIYKLYSSGDNGSNVKESDDDEEIDAEEAAGPSHSDAYEAFQTAMNWL